MLFTRNAYSIKFRREIATFLILYSFIMQHVVQEINDICIYNAIKGLNKIVIIIDMVL